MADKLDIIAFKKGLQVAKIGVLTNDIISLTGLKRDVGDILLWQDRFSYLEKHKEDFSTEEEFYYHIEQIPDIIENPNYVGLHPRDGSIQYIKQIDKIMLVGVRIRPVKSLSFRSAYPITKEYLKKYIACKTVWEIKGIDI